MELWILFSLLYPVIYSFAALIDKYIISKKVKNPYSWATYVSTVRLIFAIIIFIAISVGGAPFYALFAALMAGVANAIFHFLYFKAVSKTSMSEVVSLTYSAPIFVAILAVIFLGETLSLLKIFAILLAVAGALLLSVKKDLKLKRFYVGLVFWVIITGAVLYAIHDVLVRYISPVMSVWYIFVVTTLGFFGTTSLFTITFKKMRKGFVEILRSPSAMFLGAFNETLAVIGGIIFLTAVSLQQVSYVAAFATMVPMLVFVWTFLFSIFAPQIISEEIGPRILAKKFIAILLIVVGVLIITLT
jgi:drug/metabolite transporter (DMT)-like permease